MKKTLLLFLAMLLLMGARTAVDAQELTVSDVEFIDLNRFSEDFSIVLTKEGSILNVQLLNCSSHPSTQEFVITPKMSGGSDGEPYSVFIDVVPISIYLTEIITSFNVSFNVHGIEANSFYFSCWWYNGMVSLTEGEPLELWENKNISKDGVIYTLDNKTKTAALSNGGFVGGEYNILSELDYGGDIFNLTSINYPAFAYNSSLTSVIIPKSVTNIGAAAFYRCSNLTDLYCYAENVPTTGINVFTETPIASATLHVPAGSLEKYKATSPWSEFGNIEALKTTVETTIDGLNYFLYLDGHEAILTGGNNCPGEVDIPSEVNYNEETFVVKSMVYSAFFYNSELTRVRIPKTIESVTHHVLNGMNGAVSPDHMNPFMGCTALESVEVDEENPSFKSVDGVFFSQDGKGQYYIGPDYFNGTGLYCYPAGEKQESYIIPEGVEWIGATAFEYSQHLTTLTIPSTMICIYGSAFKGCSNLTDVYCNAENVPKTNKQAFTDCPLASATLHVPAGSVEKYKTTSPWSEFGNIVEMTTSRKILPFVQDGKVWSYKAKRLLASPEYQAEWDEIYSLEGDTVIDSHQCLKLYLTSNCPDKYLPIDYPYTGALYEDGKKVYYIAPNSTTPALLYDFSCESGTIVKVNNFELGINERKLVKYRGEYLTVIAWTPMELDEPDAYTYGYQYYWIEGIGSEIDLMNATPVWYDGGLSKYLVTCTLNGQIIYEKDDFLTSAQIVTEDPVTYTKDQIATIILPTEPDASKGKYYRLDRCEDNQIIFEQELQPRARVPYIIVPAEDFSIDPSALNLEGLHSDTVSIEGVSFIGSYVREELPALTGEDGVESSYIDFIDTTPDCGPSISAETGKESLLIGTLRAYLIVKWDDPIDHGSPSVPPFGKKEIVLHDYSTGINSLTPDPSPRRGEVFDLQGRRLSGKPERGIYIEDGKKKVK